jgi:hypothetical protein
MSNEERQAKKNKVGEYTSHFKIELSRSWPLPNQNDSGAKVDGISAASKSNSSLDIRSMQRKYKVEVPGRKRTNSTSEKGDPTPPTSPTPVSPKSHPPAIVKPVYQPKIDCLPTPSGTC